jgi:hypothetical protein
MYGIPAGGRQGEKRDRLSGFKYLYSFVPGRCPDPEYVTLSPWGCPNGSATEGNRTNYDSQTPKGIHEIVRRNDCVYHR